MTEEATLENAVTIDADGILYGVGSFEDGIVVFVYRDNEWTAVGGAHHREGTSGWVGFPQPDIVEILEAARNKNSLKVDFL